MAVCRVRFIRYDEYDIETTDENETEAIDKAYEEFKKEKTIAVALIRITTIVK